MRAILIRVGVDQAYGKWNAPVHLKTREFVFVPIPDGPKKVCLPDHSTNYEETQQSLAEFGRTHKLAASQLPNHLNRCQMHLDPDFEMLTYGDNGTRRGAGVATLSSGDLLVFYASLRSTAKPLQLIYALIGMFVVDEVVQAIDVPRHRRRENAHTRWTVVSRNDVIVRGRPGESGRFNQCIPIGSWRENAYRVIPEIEIAWGGLTVKNGYIQRSAVPPAFKNAPRFLAWLKRQDATLSRRRF